MDQLKTIIPRVRQLANTNFFKTGSRLVVGLIGVLAPGVFQRPLFYTTFEDQRHGADMVVAVMIDVHWEAARIMGRLPKCLFIQADNTSKETKNTITIFAAAWLMTQLPRTHLEQIEFAYLVVGHTHDLIDAIFAYVSKALHGEDVLSVPEMMEVLQRKMKKPPHWKHLSDMYAFLRTRSRGTSALRISRA